jgi:LacI family transcriptional regulator
MEEPGRRRSVRLEDIAQRVGVSRSEVSRVLNNRLREGRSVGVEKQQHIRRVALELGYQPNKAAQNLAQGRTDTIGLIVEPGGDYELSPHYHEIIGALTGTLSEFGLQLLLHSWKDSAADSLAQLARARTCDLLVLTDMRTDDPRPALLQAMNQPFVIRGTASGPGKLAVGMDNFAVGQLAIEYLVKWGHQRIFFQNIGRDFRAGEGRYQGYLAACATFGLEQSAQYEDLVWGEEGLYAATIACFAQPEPPTAIFASDELGALGVLRALSELGKRVPEDVSVLTCLNARFMRRILPNITTILVRQHEVAAEVGRTVGRLLSGEVVEKKQYYLSPLLDERGSCAPPAA